MVERIVIATLSRKGVLKRLAILVPTIFVFVGLSVSRLVEADSFFEKLVWVAVPCGMLFVLGPQTFWLFVRLATGSRQAVYVRKGDLILLHPWCKSILLLKITSVRPVSATKTRKEIYLEDKDGRGIGEIAMAILREAVAPTIARINKAKREAGARVVPQPYPG